MDRRGFLVGGAALAASARVWGQTPVVAKLEIGAQGTGVTMPVNFVGVSYETQQLSDLAFFSAANTGLIEQFRALTPEGVLRLGGNTSDVGWWKATPSSKQPAMHFFHEVVGEPTGSSAYAIEPLAVTNLRAFLDATGWTCLYGINLGTNTPARAAEEAAFVAKTLGSKLQYFQLGNEPDLFSRHLRDPKTWSVDLYFNEWLAEAQAIMAAVPDARFGLPDTAGAPEWYAGVVKRLSALPAAKRPNVVSLNHHYYAGGPPENPAMNVLNLLKHSEKVDKLAADIRSAAAQLSSEVGRKVPYRMTEGNTCFRGGKPGVSDVFAAALWSADYLLTLASAGYAGVNLHGGGGQQVAASLGGTLPGEKLMADPKAPHARPFYTPIAEMGGKFVAEPVSYGMRFAREFAGAAFVPVTFDAGRVNATAYAAKLSDGKTVVAVINKDALSSVSISLPTEKARVGTLTAASLESKVVSWTGPGAVLAQKTWVVPKASAMLFWLG